MTSSMKKVRENRLRRFAKIQRLTLIKSSRRDPRAWDFDRWWIRSDGTQGTAGVFGSDTRVVGDPPGFTLDEVEEFLYGGEDDESAS